MQSDSLLSNSVFKMIAVIVQNQSHDAHTFVHCCDKELCTSVLIKGLDLMMSIVVQCIGIKLLIISIFVQCIGIAIVAYDDHKQFNSNALQNYAYHKQCNPIALQSQCIGIALLMISIVLQYIGN